VNLLRAISDLQALPDPLHLAIGVFDGVHLGHRAVIERAVRAAQDNGGIAVVVTFDPHPATVLRPDQAPALLTSTRHKLRLLAALGVSHTLMLPFNDAFSKTPPADFVGQLAAAGRPLRQICVGENWAFGKGRAGNLELLRTLGGKLGFEATGVASVALDGEAVSSTAVRAAIQRGNLTAAARMLGREFSIFGTVQAGRKLARTLGFPTANVRPECEQLPPDGVYGVSVDLDGVLHAGIANIGLRPTVEKNATERLLEVHLFDFAEELVGRDLDVTFRTFLRPEKKFASLEALQMQIAADAAQARELSEKHVRPQARPQFPDC
jgi:riboflavin kinase/FMN adenylyltransferase